MLPRILIIDDLFGRTLPDGPNPERTHLCVQLGLRDVTGDGGASGAAGRNQVAEAVFCRGQRPATARVGDTVENDLAGTLEVVRQGWTDPSLAQPWSLVLLDLCFYTGRVTAASDARTPGMPEGQPGDDDPARYFGLQVLEEIHRECPQLPVLILSAMPREEVSREFTRRGALGFVPRSEANSREILRDSLWRHGLVPDESGLIVGRSRPLLLALRAARRCAPAARLHVLIQGERGTGKDLLATFINRAGPRGDRGARPLVTVDAGALTSELWQSELFGHRRGAFTGATQDRVGQLAQAHGGDLFLDEIGNMRLDVQMGLLRVIQEGTYRPLGATADERVDVRLISATNDDLDHRADVGAFRRDLLDRLRVGGTIVLPPLRERLEDLPLLVDHFVREAERSLGARRREVVADALACLRDYPWPGNLRELRTVIFEAVRSVPDVDYLVPAHLPERVRRGRGPLGSPSGPVAARAPGPVSASREEPGPAASPLDVLQWAAAQFDGHHLPAPQVRGALEPARQAIGRVVAGLLRSAFAATRRVTPDRPEGEVLIHPAMKLLTGNAQLTGSQAADLVKRLMALVPDLDTTLAQDPLLNDAWKTATRLRPGRRGRDG